MVLEGDVENVARGACARARGRGRRHSRPHTGLDVFEMGPLMQADQITARAQSYVVRLAGYVRTEEERRRDELDRLGVAVDKVVNEIERRT